MGRAALCAPNLTKGRTMTKTKPTSLVTVEPEIIEVRKRLQDPSHLEKIRDIYFKGAHDNLEFELCIQTCRHLGLDPFARQIYFLPVYDRDLGRYKMLPCVGIDGLRTIAERTGQYRGQTPPEWCGPDGEWRDIWLAPSPPAAARIGVLREGFPAPVYGVVRYSSFVKTKNGRPLGQWATMGDHMLAKCAEAQALRKTFPRDMSGDFVVENAEPNAEALNFETPDDLDDLVESIRNAPDAPALEEAIARVRGAPMDDAMKREAREAWHEANARLKGGGQQQPAPVAQIAGTEQWAEPGHQKKGQHDYGPPAMTDAEVAAAESGAQAGFGFGPGDEDQ